MVEPTKRILVVDDSEDLREFYRLVLEQAGYEVLVASSGEEALEKVKTLRPDLMLLDLIMPEMDGFEISSDWRSSGWSKRRTAGAGSGWFSSTR